MIQIFWFAINASRRPSGDGLMMKWQTKHPIAGDVVKRLLVLILWGCSHYSQLARCVGTSRTEHDPSADADDASPTIAGGAARAVRGCIDRLIQFLLHPSGLARS